METQREINALLKRMFEVRSEASILNAELESIKDRVHYTMNRMGTDELTSPHFVCTRTPRTVRAIRKNNIPRNVWERYATSDTHHVLHLKSAD